MVSGDPQQGTDMTPDIAETIKDWPPQAQERFCQLRDLILAACPDTDLIETLKWGEPAWLPAKRGVGSTLRVAWKAARPDQIGLFVNCKTTLCARVQEIYPKSFSYDGHRALRIDLSGPVDVQAIDHLARLTFHYHLKS